MSDIPQKIADIKADYAHLIKKYPHITQVMFAIRDIPKPEFERYAATHRLPILRGVNGRNFPIFLHDSNLIIYVHEKESF